jgi:hypothetical protein
MQTDSAAGTIAPTASDSAFESIRDSILAAAEARRIRREKAAAAEAAAAEAARAQRARTVTDSTGTVWLLDKPPGFGTNQVITPPDTGVRARPDPSTLIAPPVIPKLKPDTIIRPKPDTLVKPKPDKVRCCRN